MSARDAFTLEAEKLAAEIWRVFGAPPLARTVSQWAGTKIGSEGGGGRYIAKGPEKGQWRNERTPYLVEPMDCASEGSPYERIVLMFATQLGKTEVLYNAVFSRIEDAPQDMMMVLPTLNDAKEHSTQRFMPAVPYMPGVAAAISATRSRDESSTWRAKSIRGGASLFFGGANSARSLASKPLGFAALDEIDGFPDDVDGEGSPIALVEERMSNFSSRKLILSSTPTIKDFSKIETEYLASDQRKYHVPCPHCGRRQVLVWGATEEYGLKWLKDMNGDPRPETAVYICRYSDCGKSIEEHYKTDLLANGIWVPDKPGAAGGLVAGFWMSKLYSPLGWRSWAWMVSQWHKAQEVAKRGDTSLLKSFVNTNLAETWEDAGDKVNQHELAKRAEDYALRTVPWKACVLTCGVDVQKDRLEARIKAYARGEESWTVDRHIIYGDTSQPAEVPGSPWAKLDVYLRTPLQHASGRPLYILATGVDTGYNTQQVYHFCRPRAHRNILALDGREGLAAVLGKPKETLVNSKGERIRGLKLWPVGDDVAKTLIFGRMRLTDHGPGFMHFSKQLPADEYEQLTAERLITKFVNGHPQRKFVKLPGRANEALDCEKYALAAAYFLGMERWKDLDWERYEREAQVRELFDEPPPEPARPVFKPFPLPEELPVLNAMERQALEYVRNTAGGATLGNFLEDHDPVGPLLWRSLSDKGLAIDPDADGVIGGDTLGGVVTITELGAAVLAQPAIEAGPLADPDARPPVLKGRVSLKDSKRHRGR